MELERHLRNHVSRDMENSVTPVFLLWAKLKNWIDVTIGLVNTCSGRTDDAVIIWLRDIVYQPQTFLGLKRIPVDFKPLDMVFASALNIVVVAAVKAPTPNRQVTELHDRIINDSHRAIQHGWPYEDSRYSG